MKTNANSTNATASDRPLSSDGALLCRLVSCRVGRPFAGVVRLLLIVAGPLLVATGPALFAVSASAQSDQSGPIQQRWVGDLPIMNAMTIEPQLGFAFDSPEGRIVQVFATGPEDSAAVIAYYNDALSGLGWRGQDGRWNRGDEALTISQVEMASGMLWRFRLNPR